jgi:hypothetical protein
MQSANKIRRGSVKTYEVHCSAEIPTEFGTSYEDLNQVLVFVHI